MRKKLLLVITIILISVIAIRSHRLTYAQSVWPPIKMDVQSIVVNNRLTFEIKVTNEVDWNLMDFTIKCGVPPDTAYTEGHGDFDGAAVNFDGVEVSFSVTELPARATLGYRYTVEIKNGKGEIYPPEIWAAWKGRLPGQFLFNGDPEPINVKATAEATPNTTPQPAATRGLKIIHVQGDAYQQGLMRGQSLKWEILLQIQSQLEPLLSKAYNGDRTQWLSAIHTQITQVAPEVLEELRGMADGSGVSMDDLEILNFAPYVAPANLPTATTVSCSLLAVTQSASQSGTPIIGRQQSLANRNIPPAFIVRHFADTRPPRLDLTLPASLEMLVSVSANGTFWEAHPVPCKETIPAHASDMMSFIGEALRQSRTVDELQQALTATPRLKAMNMTIAGSSQNQARTLELAYTQYKVLQPIDGILVSTDHFVSPEMDSLQPPPINQSAARYNRLLELAQSNRGAITPQLMQTFIHDPQIWDGSGFSVVVDLANMKLTYWEENYREWIDLSLPELFNTSGAASPTIQP